MSGWDRLKSILDESRRELEHDLVDKQDRCPHDGEILEYREDGTMFCRYDGTIHLFEKSGEENRH